MDILSMLEQDHRKVEGLFAEYDAENQGVVAEIKKELDLHTRIEEKVLYPVMRDVLTNGNEDADHAIAEHDKVDELMARVVADPSDQDLVYQLQDEVDHHVQEEENDLFPRMREACDQNELDHMGMKAQEMKDSEA